LLTVWEVRVRSYGYEPYMVDNAGLWAIQRNRIGDEGKDAVVFTGSSRLLFDTDLSQWREATGRPTIQLAAVGTSPRMFMEDLAGDPDFTGLLVVGVTPPLFFTERGGYMASVLDYYQHESPSAWLGQRLGMMLEARFAFLDRDNLPLFTLLKHIKMPNREGVSDPYWEIWKLEDNLPDRQTWMWPRVYEDKAYQEKSQQSWLHLLDAMAAQGGGGPPPQADEAIADAKEQIDKIRAKGGEVVFVRAPSSGPFREIEDQGFPREKYWDRLLAETGSVGVHFEDQPETNGYSVPEWSHLRKDEAIDFTAHVIRLLDEKLKAEGKPGIIRKKDGS
ncbi:MAG TPA: hypothetical protein VD713_00825, partial [Sphingomonadales bacterium]|nr:hypothetical protein [Sphingomonadales bacterium]